MTINVSDYDAALATMPRERQQVHNPHVLLWETLLDLALQRINFVLDFARNWPAIQLEQHYELRRAKCIFHLEWIFDDDPTDRFTFRELCRFSDSPDLQDVEPARQRIKQAFCPEAVVDLRKPVAGKLRNHVVQAWLGNEIGTML